MEQDEFEALVREHASLVRGLVYHILRSPNDVEDVTQDVFIKAYESLSSFRGGSFRAYVSQIARNHCYDVLRRGKSRRHILDTAELSDNLSSSFAEPEPSVLASELASELQTLLAQMARVDREILLMKHVYGFSYEEIAACLQMRVGTVRTRVSRSRQRLVTALEGRENGEPSILG